MLAGGPASRGLNVLFQVRLGLSGLRAGAPIALFDAMGPTLGDSRGPVALLMQRVQRDEPS